MKVINTIQALRDELAAARAEGKTVGLVPTMGALHEGHASLVRRSVKENDVTVVSIFLNPTQFNDKGDLERYPRTLEADCALLEQCRATIAFAPSVEEIYPEPDTRQFSYPPTDTVMEGAHRPGHFNGVCQVVSKLFSYVEPDRAYFGEKDFQQICPVVRERSGLAMSSRNTLLTPEERRAAARIYSILEESKDYAVDHELEEVRERAIRRINEVSELEVEYYSIVDGNTLEDVHSWDDSDSIVGCITVYCGQKPIRLIDHIRYK